jgi:tetratricopeptide (TPR) repeat protein
MRMNADLPSDTARQLQALLGRGFEALSSGELRVAGECCRSALQIQPDLVQAHFLVGLVALESRERQCALRAFRTVVRLERDHGAAWAHLARLYMGGGQVNRADAALRETLRIRPDQPAVLDLIGSTLSLMGEHGAAKTFYRRACAGRPDFPPFQLNLANNLVYHGETAAAAAIFRHIIALQPDSPLAHWGLSGATRATDTAHIEQMQTLLPQRESDLRGRACYCYAIGKECEDLGRWDEAFASFSGGAAARRTTVDYDEQAEIAMFDYLEASYTRAWFDALPEGNADPSPIFVLGQPRTGSTLVERIISSHSLVHSAGELQQLELALRRLSQYSKPLRFSRELFAAARELEPAKIAGMYLQTTGRMRGSVPRFVDKLPQNYLLLPLILKALPNARVVHLVRDPMDACFAGFKQLFADAYPHSYEQGEMARHHARYRRLMQVWRERFPGRFLDIGYEATARDPEPASRALLDFLSLPWEESCLAFHEQGGAVSTASAVQVREPAHTRSIGRWRRYEHHLQPMAKALRQAGVPVQ